MARFPHVVVLLALGCAAGPSGYPDPPEVNQPVEPGGDSGVSADDTAVDTGDSGDTGPTDLPDDDGDGYIDTTHGGDDCDDDDPRSHPGATERCDGTDQDCDGIIAEAGMCHDPVVLDDDDPQYVGVGYNSLTWLYRSEFGPDHPNARTFAHHTWFQPADGPILDGMYAISVMRAEIPTGRAWVLDHTAATWVGDGDTRPKGAIDAGDVDGDGFEDVWLWTIGDFNVGRLFLMRGPDTDWDPEPQWLGEAADATWYEEDGAAGFANLCAGGSDRTGDGLADALVEQTGNSVGDQWRKLYFVRGRTDARGSYDVGEDVTLTLGDPEVEWPGGADSWARWAEPPEGIPDFDGDGFDDFFTSWGGGSYAVVSSADLTGADGATWEQVFNLAPSPAAENRSPSLYRGKGTTNSPGDVDGDGLDDLAVRSSTPTGVGIYDICTSFVASSVELLVGIESKTLLKVCGDSREFGGLYLLADLDDDGLGDPAVDSTSTPDGALLVSIVPSTRWTLGGSVTSAEFAGPAFQVAVANNGSTSLSILDLDQDGAGELVIQDPRAAVDYEYQGQAWILEHFLLPGDHPEIW